MNPKNLVIGFAAVLVLVAVIAVLTRSGDQKPTEQVAVSTTIEKPASASHAHDHDDHDHDHPHPHPHAPVDDQPGLNKFSPPLENSDTPPEILADPDAEPIHFYNEMDPADQPREFHRTSFEGLENFPEGFDIVGEGYLSPDGWKLNPGSGSPDDPRSALIESPVFELDFPSNAITSGWKENSPEGTEVLIEIAASPDGENWTSWYPTTGAHMDGEVLEYNEVSGEYNPSYGYTQGDMVFFGLGKYQYYKYNIMLYSEIDESPSVSGFYVYQQDTTMGEGYEVEYSEGTDITKGEQDS